jgi:hypothetical protein
MPRMADRGGVPSGRDDEPARGWPAYWDLRSLLDWLPDVDDEYASGPGLARLERYLERLLDAADAHVA